MDSELSEIELDKHSQQNGFEFPFNTTKVSSPVENVSSNDISKSAAIEVDRHSQQNDLRFPFDNNKVNPEVENVSNNDISKSAAMKHKWNNFVEASTLHGLQYIFTSRTLLRRVIWALFLLVGIAWFSFQSSRLLNKYFSYPFTTKVSLEYEKALEFPAISICNVNPIRRSVVMYDGYEEIMNYLIHARLQTNKLDNLTKAINWTNYKNFNTTELYLRGAHPIEETLLGCSWREEICSSKNFTPVMTSMGLCYTFNSGKDGQPILRMREPGANFGLRLIINVQQDDYYGVLTHMAGLRVLIHHHDTPPMVEQLGFSAAPGTSTFVDVRKERVKSLRKPYKSNCSEDISNLPGYTKYTTSACRMACETRFVVEKCGCKAPGMPSDAEVCKPRQMANCIYRETGIYSFGDYECHCPVPCDVISYKPTLSYAAYPNENYVANVIQTVLNPELLTPEIIKLTDEYIRKNQVEIRVFFKELSYQLVEEQPAYNYESLLGEIGGQVGLCVGASLLTVLEFCDVIFTILGIRLGFR